MPAVQSHQPLLSGDDVRAAARACGFPLVGLARAEPLDPAPLPRWLAAGYADTGWMERNVADRLDPARVLPGARSVLALAIPYHRAGAERSPIARYARGRDYHYAHRAGMALVHAQYDGLRRNAVLALAAGRRREGPRT